MLNGSCNMVRVPWFLTHERYEQSGSVKPTKTFIGRACYQDQYIDNDMPWIVLHEVCFSKNYHEIQFCHTTWLIRDIWLPINIILRWCIHSVFFHEHQFWDDKYFLIIWSAHFLGQRQTWWSIHRWKPYFIINLSPHKRPDRDTYVTVLTQHLLDQCLGAFEKMEVFPDEHFSKGLNCH